MSEPNIAEHPLFIQNVLLKQLIDRNNGIIQLEQRLAQADGLLKQMQAKEEKKQVDK